MRRTGLVAVVGGVVVVAGGPALLSASPRAGQVAVALPESRVAFVRPEGRVAFIRPEIGAGVRPEMGAGRTPKAKPTPSASPTAKKSSASPSPSPSPSTPTPSANIAQCNPTRGYTGPLGPESWAQKRLGFTRVWALTQGEGVTAAVIDSGVQDDHPMLAGRIADFIDLTGTGKRDCNGHGTGVASILGGKDLSGQGVPFTGVAPAVRLLIIKLQNTDYDQQGTTRLPDAIRTAANKGAKVVNISVKAPAYPALESAIRYAQSKDVLVVAAAGNADQQSGEGGTPAYPAGYSGVLSVASMGPDGARAETSSVQSRVDLSAPGSKVESAWTGGYNLQAEGTSFAAPYAAGVAALVRSYHPRLTYQQVIHRLVVTADGTAGKGTGEGMVDPVRAVTAVLPEEGAAGAAAPAAVRRVRLAAAKPTDHRAQTIALAVIGGSLGIAVCVVVVGIALPAGRSRGWRPGRMSLPGS